MRKTLLACALLALPVLKGWLAPLSSLGASVVVANPTGSTDHVGMVRLGLRADDLRQASAVLASVLLSAANSDENVPANVMPTRPDGSDPFKYKDPATD